jgi:DHA2 family multidrug resistance protein
MLSIPIYSFVANRVDLRWLMMIGLAGFGLSMWFFVPITHDWGWGELLLPQALRGASQQFAVAPVVTLTLGGLAPERLKLASGLFNLMRNLGGAIGIAACGTVLIDRGNLHLSRLADSLNNANLAMTNMVDTVQSAFLQQGYDLVSAHAAALRQLWRVTLRESQTQAFSDAFLLVMVCFVIATAMVPLMRKPGPAPKQAVADAH